MKSKYLFIICAIVIGGFITSCKKTSFITSSDALLFTSTDTLHFGTVFTATGSITQSFKIFNPNDQKLLINKVALQGGTASSFKLNIDGTASSSFSNIEIAPNDSMYIFVAVNISNGTTSFSFFIQDSIGINYNGKEIFVQLDAYGQNARFLKNAAVTKDTSWSNDLPVVIIGAFNVNQGKTLTINKGVQVYCHADAAVTINGSLKTFGEKDESERIIFRSDRLDDYYKDLPGSWPGISFAKSSINNQLNYTNIYNATNAVFADNPATNNNPKIIMNQCIISNASVTGIFGVYSSINATNCLISNCANNIKIAAGGNYNFTHCTIASYNTNLLFHETPVLSIGDIDDNNQSFPLAANFVNSIFYGDDGYVTEEIAIQQTVNNPFSLNFENVLYKSTNSATTGFINSIQGLAPGFVSIDYTNNKFDFHLLPESPCVNAGKSTLISLDLDGNPRDNSPDIGCYELQ